MIASSFASLGCLSLERQHAGRAREVHALAFLRPALLLTKEKLMKRNKLMHVKLIVWYTKFALNASYCKSSNVPRFNR